MTGARITTRARSLAVDELAELVALPRPGLQFCERCGERVPPDEQSTRLAEEPCCRACQAALGFELSSYVSHHSGMRHDL